MDQQILQIILKDTYSLSQLKHRLSVLKTSLEQTFFGGEEKILNQADQVWVKSLPTGLLQNFDKNNIVTIFEDLKKGINKLQILTIYLSFDPDEAAISQIGEFAKKTFQTPHLLDIKYDPGLIAGCSLVWKGIYKNYSLKSKIDEKKLEVLRSFQAFLR